MVLYAFDGTGCTDEGDEMAASNVVKLRNAYTNPVLYLCGIGTGGNIAVNHFNAKWGRGGQSIIEAAMAGGIQDSNAAQIVAADAPQHLEEGNEEEIDVVGYSRGAALAIHFANELKDRHNLKVRFLGLSDTVASFGLPRWASNRGDKLTLPDTVEHCYHALALHERREEFVLTRVKATEELWFRGVHRDIGGAGNIGLSSITLCWMLQHAKSHGLPVKESYITKYRDLCRPGDDVSENLDLIEGPWRELSEDDRFHESVPASDRSARLSGKH
jgi:pimeloyl-ACP methyl ester carboxylesterase